MEDELANLAKKAADFQKKADEEGYGRPDKPDIVDEVEEKLTYDPENHVWSHQHGDAPETGDYYFPEKIGFGMMGPPNQDTPIGVVIGKHRETGEHVVVGFQINDILNLVAAYNDGVKYLKEKSDE